MREKKPARITAAAAIYTCPNCKWKHRRVRRAACGLPFFSHSHVTGFFRSISYIYIYTCIRLIRYMRFAAATGANSNQLQIFLKTSIFIHNTSPLSSSLPTLWRNFDTFIFILVHSTCIQWLNQNFPYVYINLRVYNFEYIEWTLCNFNFKIFELVIFVLCQYYDVKPTVFDMLYYRQLGWPLLGFWKQ